MSKITFYPELFLEETEMNRFRKFLEDDGFRKMFVSFSESFGVVKKESLPNSLQVYNSSSTKVGVRAGYAFTAQGNLIHVSADLSDLFTLTDDNTLRKVFIQYEETQIEEGTLQLNTNGTIVGTGTKFLETLKTGKRIEIINSSLGNNGTYEVSTVTNDLNLATTSTFVAESGLSYKVKGVYTPTVTISDGNSRPFYLDTVNITLESTSVSNTDNKICFGWLASQTDILAEDWVIIEGK